MVRVVGFFGLSKVLFPLHAKKEKGIAIIIATTMKNEIVFLVLNLILNFR